MNHWTIRPPALRTVLTVAAASATAVALPAVAIAKPFEIPPTPVLCASGIATPHSYAQGGDINLPPEIVAYVINEEGGEGAMVTWLNVSELLNGTFTFGTEELAPYTLEDGFVRPLVIANTGPGTVVSTMYGFYENAAGEQCLLLPGVTTDEVPGAAG